MESERMTLNGVECYDLDPMMKWSDRIRSKLDEYFINQARMEDYLKGDEWSEPVKGEIRKKKIVFRPTVAEHLSLNPDMWGMRMVPFGMFVGPAFVDWRFYFDWERVAREREAMRSYWWRVLIGIKNYIRWWEKI